MENQTLTQTAKIPISVIKINNIFITSDGEEVTILNIEKPIEGFTMLKWKGGFGLFDNRAVIKIKI
jgi:hypothetical protein